jgi:hypothetical protein
MESFLSAAVEDVADDWGFFVDIAANEDVPVERTFLNGFNAIHRSSKLQTISDSGL